MKAAGLTPHVMVALMAGLVPVCFVAGARQLKISRLAIPPKRPNFPRPF